MFINGGEDSGQQGEEDEDTSQHLRVQFLTTNQLELCRSRFGLFVFLLLSLSAVAKAIHWNRCVRGTDVEVVPI
jgi:hypothetical protein